MSSHLLSLAFSNLCAMSRNGMPLPGTDIAFSSYRFVILSPSSGHTGIIFELIFSPFSAGALYSSDDFYTIMPSHMVTQETTIGVSDSSLYAKYITPQSVFICMPSVVLTLHSCPYSSLSSGDGVDS